MWTLYGSDGSGSAAVKMALKCCAVPFEIRRDSTWEPDSAQDRLRQVNPLGQILKLKCARAHLQQHRPALLAQLLRVESQPDLAPVFARHWPPAR